MTARTDTVALPVKPERRDARQAMWRGFRKICPNCGQGTIFYRYLKIRPQCDSCGEDLSHHRADDAPAYVTMMMIGHVLIVGVALVEDIWAPSTAVQLVIWLPLATLLTLWLLPHVKGAIVGLQWAARMHGFGEEPIGVAHNENPNAPAGAARTSQCR